MSELRKCSRCNSNQLLNETYYKKNRKGEFNKTCITCANRNNNKCEHGKRKNRCKDCGGSQIC